MRDIFHQLRIFHRRNPYLRLFALIAVGSVALLAFLLGAAHRGLQEQAATNARNLTEVLETRLEATLHRVEATLTTLAEELPPAAMTAAAVPYHGPMLHRRLALLAQHFPEITGLRLIDREGTVLYASELAQPDGNARGRDYFNQLREHPDTPVVYSEVTQGRLSGRPQLFIAVPVKDGAGNFLGVALAALEIGYLQSIFDAVDLGPQGVITFRRSDDGRLVLRRPAKPNTVNQSLQNNPMHQRIEAGERAGTIRYLAAIDGVDRIYAFQRVANYPFYVAAGIALDDLLVTWRRTAATAIVATLLGLTAIALLLARLGGSQRREQRATGALQASEDRFHLLLNAVGEGICGVDLGGNTTFCNPAALSLCGLDQESELLGHNLLDRVLEHHSGERTGQGDLSPCRDTVLEALAHGETYRSEEAYLRQGDGSLVNIRFSACPLIRNGQSVGGAVFFSDLSAQRESEARIAYLVSHDALTGLPNRMLAEDRFRQAAALVRRHGGRVALIALDLDNFKTINDSLGHRAGDQLLQAVVTRLAGLLRETDTLCRTGGDEFLLVVPDMAGHDTLAPYLEKLRQTLAQPFELKTQSLATTVSLGVALYPDDGADFALLLQQADTAMYHAKDAGRDTYRLFNPAMQRRAQASLSLRFALQRALEQGEFRLHYQPQQHLREGCIVGVEALLRWQDPDRGLVPPDQFIPLAEQSGLIVPMGQWVLGEACRQGANWNRQRQTPLRVAVNISALQFKRGNLVETVTEALEDSGLSPHLLELELTESTLLQQTEEVQPVLTRLAALGVRLAIDDFGTGYSSLAYLKRLSVHALKIDRSFVADLLGNPEDVAIVRAIIDMAHALNLHTVAEGVECAEVRDRLAAFGCDEMQGFYLARPLPPAALEAFLASQAKADQA